MASSSTQNKKIADLLPSGLKFERSSKLTSLWAGYGSIYKVTAREDHHSSVTRPLIVKEVAPPPGEVDGVSHSRKLHSYQVEAAFYQEVAPKLVNDGLAIATALHVDNDLTPRGGSMHLLLTDLTEAYPHHIHKFDIDHAKAALSWLASLHSSYWQQPTPVTLWRQGTFWQLDTRHEELEAMEPEYRALGLYKHAQRINDELANSKFTTIVHGDFKAANIVFNDGIDEPLAAAAYDFQYVGGGDGMKDVAYMFCSALESRVLGKHEDELLEHYRSELLSRLPPSVAEEYTMAVMKERLNLAVCDFVRFMAGWGWWGNVSWASQKCKNYLRTLK